MMMHRSVLLRESIEGLAIVPDGIYVDGTFGRGGHSQAILEKLGPKGRLIAIDKDDAALTYGRAKFANEPRITLCKGSFASITAILQSCNVNHGVQGILLDLGVSSPQLDEAVRGFSFMHEGPLDMRMDTHASLSAATFIEHASVEEMTDVFRRFGEERYALKIARAIAAKRAESPITTTTALAAIVKEAHPKWEKHKHPATRVFQAIRIHINHELTDLTTGLAASVQSLAVGGKLVVISFHSLEDRIVKHFMRDEEQGEVLPFSVPVKTVELKTCFRRVGKAIKPHEDEVKDNVRSRSAVLRIGEKIA